MNRINLITGILLLIIFAATGQYMQHVLKPQHLADLTFRMEVRANHIYILFAAVLNLVAYRLPVVEGPARNVFRITGFLIFLGGCISVPAFFFDPVERLKKGA